MRDFFLWSWQCKNVGGGARDEIARVYHIVRCNAIAPMGGGVDILG